MAGGGIGGRGSSGGGGGTDDVFRRSPSASLNAGSVADSLSASAMYGREVGSWAATPSASISGLRPPLADASGFDVLSSAANPLLTMSSMERADTARGGGGAESGRGEPSSAAAEETGDMGGNRGGKEGGGSRGASGGGGVVAEAQGPSGRYTSSARSSVTASLAASVGRYGRGGGQYGDDDGGASEIAEEDSVASGRVGGGGTFFTALLR